MRFFSSSKSAQTWTLPKMALSLILAVIIVTVFIPMLYESPAMAETSGCSLGLPFLCSDGSNDGKIAAGNDEDYNLLMDPERVRDPELTPAQIKEMLQNAECFVRECFVPSDSAHAHYMFNSKITVNGDNVPITFYLYVKRNDAGLYESFIYLVDDHNLGDRNDNFNSFAYSGINYFSPINKPDIDTNPEARHYYFMNFDLVSSHSLFTNSQDNDDCITKTASEYLKDAINKCLDGGCVEGENCNSQQFFELCDNSEVNFQNILSQRVDMSTLTLGEVSLEDAKKNFNQILFNKDKYPSNIVRINQVSELFNPNNMECLFSFKYKYTGAGANDEEHTYYVFKSKLKQCSNHFENIYFMVGDYIGMKYGLRPDLGVISSQLLLAGRDGGQTIRDLDSFISDYMSGAHSEGDSPSKLMFHHNSHREKHPVPIYDEGVVGFTYNSFKTSANLNKDIGETLSSVLPKCGGFIQIGNFIETNELTTSQLDEMINNAEYLGRKCVKDEGLSVFLFKSKIEVSNSERSIFFNLVLSNDNGVQQGHISLSESRSTNVVSGEDFDEYFINTECEDRRCKNKKVFPSFCTLFSEEVPTGQKDSTSNLLKISYKPIEILSKKMTECGGCSEPLMCDDITKVSFDLPNDLTECVTRYHKDVCAVPPNYHGTANRQFDEAFANAENNLNEYKKSVALVELSYCVFKETDTFLRPEGWDDNDNVLANPDYSNAFKECLKDYTEKYPGFPYDEITEQNTRDFIGPESKFYSLLNIKDDYNEAVQHYNQVACMLNELNIGALQRMQPLQAGVED